MFARSRLDLEIQLLSHNGSCQLLGRGELDRDVELWIAGLEPTQNGRQTCRKHRRDTSDRDCVDNLSARRDGSDALNLAEDVPGQ